MKSEADVEMRRRALGFQLAAMLFMCALLAVSALPATAGDPGGKQTLAVDEIDLENIMSIVEELASREYGGRLAGTDGNRKAAEYIAGYFRRIGLECPEGLENYMQPYSQRALHMHSAPTLQAVDQDGNITASLRYVQDFSVSVLPGLNIKGTVTAPAVVIDTMEQLSGELGPVMGKILLVPGRVAPALLRSEEVLGRLARPASGIKGIIVAIDMSTKRQCFPVSAFVLPGGYGSPASPMFFTCDSRAFRKLTDAVASGSLIRMSADYSVEVVQAANIVGMISGSPGSGSKQDQGLIIIGAHFDHVGDNLNGTYNPGALDNASGTAAMMEIARVMMESGAVPKKSVLFIAFNGEEQSMAGSGHFADNPAYPLDNAVMINIDTVGAQGNEALEIAALSREDSSSRPLLRENLCGLAASLGIPAREATAAGSDHSSFARKGVDAVSLFHPGCSAWLHCPMDTPDRVDPKRVAEVVRLVLHYIHQQAY